MDIPGLTPLSLTPPLVSQPAVASGGPYQEVLTALSAQQATTDTTTLSGTTPLPLDPSATLASTVLEAPPQNTTAAEARATYAQAVDLLTAETLARDTEAAVQLKVLTPATPPGSLEAAMLLTGQGPTSNAAILGGAMLGFWPGPTAELMEANAAFHLREDKPTSILRAKAIGKTSDNTGHAADSEAAQAAYRYEEESEEDAPPPTIDILD